jgi:hypothetical protein
MRGIGFPDATSAVKSLGFPVPRLRVGLSSEITVRPGPSYRELDVVLVTDAGDDLVWKLCVVSVFTFDLQRAARLHPAARCSTNPPVRTAKDEALAARD